MDHYIAALYAIVTKGLNANSYKFALWRALASLASGTDKKRPTISKQQLAPLFLSYYWPLEVKYHIRQGIDPDKDPVVMKRIRELMDAGFIRHGDSLHDFQKHWPEKYRVLVARVAKDAFDDVIPRFHKVRGEPIDPCIYTYSGIEGQVGEVI